MGKISGLQFIYFIHFKSLKLKSFQFCLRKFRTENLHDVAVTDPRGAVMFVVLLHEVGEGSWSSGSSGSSGLPSRGPRGSCLACPWPGVEDQLEPAVTVAAHFPLRVQALAVAPDTVAALDTPEGGNSQHRSTIFIFPTTTTTPPYL